MPFSRLLSSNLAHAGAKPAGNGGAVQRTEDRCQRTDVRCPINAGRHRDASRGARHPGLGKAPGTQTRDAVGASQRTEVRSQKTDVRPTPPRFRPPHDQPPAAERFRPAATSRTLFTMSTNPMPDNQRRHPYNKTNNPRRPLISVFCLLSSDFCLLSSVFCHLTPGGPGKI